MILSELETAQKETFCETRGKKMVALTTNECSSPVADLMEKARRVNQKFL